MAEQCFLGLDIGTTGCKTVVFRQDGRDLSRAYREYPICSQEPLQAQQNANLVLQNLFETMTQAVTAAGVDEIAGLCISVQGDAVIPVDKEFVPLYPAVLGMDYRPSAQCDAYAAKYGKERIYELTGQPLHPINMMAKILWLKAQRPQIFAEAFRFVTYEEFVLYHLGAEPKLDLTMASRSMGFDVHKKVWSEELLSNMEIPAEKLSAVCETGVFLGRMRPELAKKLGLKNCPAIFAGGHDQPIGAIGAGAIGAGDAVDSTGTAEVLSAVYPGLRINPVMERSFYTSYYHAVPGLCFTFAHMQVGGILQRWYRDNLALGDVQAAKEAGEDFFAMSHTRCPKEPSSVLVLPHFNGSGTPLCDVHSKGAMIGLTLNTSRYDILKGILEGLCFELKTNLNTMELAEIEIRRIVAVGGGARSSLWLQTKANITNRRIETISCREAGCLGAAILAAVGCGAYGNLPEAVSRMVHKQAVFEPQESAVAEYARRYELYSQIYDSLKEIHHKM